MTGIAMTVKKRPAAGGSFDSTSFTADSSVASGATSLAQVDLNTDGTATLTGDAGTSPVSPRWWSGSPPDTWISYSSTGGGTLVGGLTAGTRYKLDATRTLGIQRTALGETSRTFTISYYDAATGGNLVGTKTFVASVEVA